LKTNNFNAANTPTEKWLLGLVSVNNEMQTSQADH